MKPRKPTPRNVAPAYGWIIIVAIRNEHGELKGDWASLPGQFKTKSVAEYAISMFRAAGPYRVVKGKQVMA